MTETVLSVGIDIGTSTTQLIFSALEVENTAGVASVPRISVVEKKILRRSDIYFTPLISPTVIDTEGVRQIVTKEYNRAGMSPQDISAGAIIITGETARKENAEALLQSLSDLAGDFVVATAGSDLESILAGRGSGAAQASKDNRTTVANFDMGGGTTNVALFTNGDVVDTTCLDIGGRLVRLDKDDAMVTYVAPKMGPVIQSLGIDVREGQKASSEDLKTLARRMAGFFDELLGLAPKSPLFRDILTAHDLRSIPSLHAVAFSGGVADGMNAIPPGGLFAYGDIGVLLGQAVTETAMYRTFKVLPTKETIRATVVGAGTHSMDISGSTIGFSDESRLPVKNLPILKLSKDDEGLEDELSQKIQWFTEKDPQQVVAVALKGTKNPSFDLVQSYGQRILKGLSEYLRHNDLVVVVVENDMAKALGYALGSFLPEGTAVISIDGISVHNGDYIDLGRPLAKGRVIPVVIKTLVFGK
ncbi:MAG: ethanolamine ammonia-lyase reactivating factor EutA [Dethiosulfovibrio peptidovorans]|nr:MAG: ethanolamine ammonia-lyase reactivating factor EutA [Dethiosulfovibrio peptidovorans]